VKDRTPTAKRSSTRDRLVAVAERCFAERGIEGVTLNEVYKASGEKNKNVLYYHFGSKEGVVQAILDKHRPGIAARRDALLDEAIAKGNGTPALRDIVRAAVEPVAEKLNDPDGGKYFVRIAAQISVRDTLAMQDLYPKSIKFTHPPDRFLALLRTRLEGLPEAVILHRFMIVATMIFHGIADYSRLIDAYQGETPLYDSTLFFSNLEEAVVAVMSSKLTARINKLLPAPA
jgi:AcrR family transcriptional regulator